MNKSTSRYRRLMEIGSRNSFRKCGYDPKSLLTLTTIYGERLISYKDQIVLKNNG